MKNLSEQMQKHCSHWGNGEILRAGKRKSEIILSLNVGSVADGVISGGRLFQVFAAAIYNTVVY